jgi:signal transduction histidine kinase
VRNLFSFAGQVFSGLRFRLLVLVVLVCAPLVVLILHAGGEDRRLAMSAWQQRAQRTLRSVQCKEREVIADTKQVLLALSVASGVGSLNPRQCKDSLDEVFAVHRRYANLGVMLTNGQVLASALPIADADHEANRPFIETVLEQRAFSIFKFDGRHEHIHEAIRFGAPILDSAGHMLAVAFADLDLNWLDQFGADVPSNLTTAAAWALVSRAGMILGHYPKPETWVGRQLPEASLVPSFFREPEGSLEATNSAGIQSFYAFASIPSQLMAGDVAMVLGVPTEALFADADRVLKRNLAWLVGAALLALALGLAGSKVLILQPVRSLVQSSARLAAGDFGVRRGAPRSRDELGQLTLAFDQMAQALEQRELERQRATHKLHALSQRLVEVQETERRHIARELHDEIGQSLTAAELNLQAALRAPGTAALERRLEESIQAVERVLEQVHDLSLNLRPSMLDDLGLEPALRWFTHRQASLTGMKAEFRAEPLDGRLDSIIETECFRVAQEALTNIVRHAKARAVLVELRRNNGHLHLSVRDDGVGFDVSALRSEAVMGASLGLLSMEERTALAGGGIELKSRPGEGTEVHAWFPLRWQGTPSLTLVNE